jgi:hypothetical protein
MPFMKCGCVWRIAAYVGCTCWYRYGKRDLKKGKKWEKGFSSYGVGERF